MMTALIPVPMNVTYCDALLDPRRRRRQRIQCDPTAMTTGFSTGDNTPSRRDTAAVNVALQTLLRTWLYGKFATFRDAIWGNSTGTCTSLRDSGQLDSNDDALLNARQRRRQGTS